MTIRELKNFLNIIPDEKLEDVVWISTEYCFGTLDDIEITKEDLLSRDYETLVPRSYISEDDDINIYEVIIPEEGLILHNYE